MMLPLFLALFCLRGDIRLSGFVHCQKRGVNLALGFVCLLILQSINSNLSDPLSPDKDKLVHEV